MAETLEQARARSEASGRYRSQVCNNCYFISQLGRCQNLLSKPRYATECWNRDACEDWVFNRDGATVRNKVHLDFNYKNIFKP